MNFSTSELIQFAKAALQEHNVPTEDAQITAVSLVQADQRGITSHGLLRLPLYVKAIVAGGINPVPNVKIATPDAATTTIDGDNGLGQVVMRETVNWAAQSAQNHGVSVAAVENSSHYGAGAFWTDRLAAAGLVSFLTSSTGPVVAPYGGRNKILGTNPLTIAMPSAGAHPLTVDMATSAGAYGKVMAAKQAGTQIPEGWAVDREGNPTVDPAEAAQGALLPFGGHKGSGLSVLLEGLAAGLSSAAYAFKKEDIWDNPASAMNNGHFLITINPGQFNGREAAEQKVGQLQAAVQESGPNAVSPGQYEYDNEKSNEHTLQLTDSQIEPLQKLATEIGVEFPKEASEIA